MKTIKILLLVSILAVTQSFALSKTQKNILLGLGAGVIIIHTLKSHNKKHYKKPHNKIVYVDTHNSYPKHKKHHMKKHHHHNQHGYNHAHHHNKRYYRDDSRYDFFTARDHYRKNHNRY